jgi:large subunit ribosomal protein L9
MKVVFLQNVEGSGRTGEIKEVADGFARNFLLPRRLAAAATPDAVKRAEARAVIEARQQAELDEKARTLGEKLVASIVITARVGEKGRLYGSVTSGDIAEEVSKLAGEEVDRHLLVLEEPIKELGTYEIPLRLSRNVEATVTVEVVGEGPAEEGEKEKEEGAPKARRKAKKAGETEELAASSPVEAGAEEPTATGSAETVEEEPKAEVGEKQEPEEGEQN